MDATGSFRGEISGTKRPESSNLHLKRERTQTEPSCAKCATAPSRSNSWLRTEVQTPTQLRLSELPGRGSASRSVPFKIMLPERHFESGTTAEHVLPSKQSRPPRTPSAHRSRAQNHAPHPISPRPPRTGVRLRRPQERRSKASSLQEAAQRCWSKMKNPSRRTLRASPRLGRGSIDDTERRPRRPLAETCRRR